MHEAITQPRQMSAEVRLQRLDLGLRVALDDLRHLSQTLPPELRLHRDAVTLAGLCAEKAIRCIGRLRAALGTIGAGA